MSLSGHGNKNKNKTMLRSQLLSCLLPRLLPAARRRSCALSASTSAASRIAPASPVCCMMLDLRRFFLGEFGAFEGLVTWHAKPDCKGRLSEIADRKKSLKLGRRTKKKKIPSQYRPSSLRFLPALWPRIGPHFCFLFAAPRIFPPSPTGLATVSVLACHPDQQRLGSSAPTRHPRLGMQLSRQRYTSVRQSGVYITCTYGREQKSSTAANQDSPTTTTPTRITVRLHLARRSRRQCAVHLRIAYGAQHLNRSLIHLLHISSILWLIPLISACLAHATPRCCCCCCCCC